MTPGEFNKTSKAMRDSEEEKLGLLALLVAEVNAPHVKRPKPPKWYLDRWTKRPEQPNSTQQKFQSLMQKMHWQQTQDALAKKRDQRGEGQ